MMSRLSTIFVVGFLVGLAAPACQAGGVVFIQGLKKDSVSQRRLELATQFYGIDLRTLQVGTHADATQALSSLRSGETLAAVLSADVVPLFPKEVILSSLRRPNAKNVPFLVLGVTPHSDSHLLASWSDDALMDCHPLAAAVSRASYVVGSANQVTRELAAQEIPNLTFPGCGFTTDPKRGVQALLSLSDGKESKPVFVWEHSASKEMFFLAEMKTNDSSVSPARLGVVEMFSRLAPIMMFIRYSAGDKAWHSEGNYANLTIDDPWLTEPYGHLDYKALLEEMEAHNFHTTIGFIPWNFDRSEPGVVELFRSHADRFSISIHGNNHDHAEFGSYDKRPLNGQIAGIGQALARMEKFQSLTSLPFDRVMIFPHDVAPPELTLRKLKEYNFVAAVSPVTARGGSLEPADPLFALRAVSLGSANFPLVRRYYAEAEVSKLLIAVNAFLGNPLLFYGHQSLFTVGIGAFDPIAATVNQIQPDTRWDSLGHIVQHLYLVRLRPDSNYDVQAFASDFILHNQLQRDLTFYVDREEDHSAAIKSVTIDGRPCSYELSGQDLRLTVLTSPGESRHIVIQYKNDLNLPSVDVAKKGLYLAFLREASDFRDITLSRGVLGRAITRVYYEDHFVDLESEAERSFSIILALAVFFIAVGWLYRRRARAVHATTAKQPNAAARL